jgi:hypothetical protein
MHAHMLTIRVCVCMCTCVQYCTNACVGCTYFRRDFPQQGLASGGPRGRIKYCHFFFTIATKKRTRATVLPFVLGGRECVGEISNKRPSAGW